MSRTKINNIFNYIKMYLLTPKLLSDKLYNFKFKEKKKGNENTIIQ